MGEIVVSSIEQLKDDKFEHYWPLIQAQLRMIPHVWEPWWTLDSIREFTLNNRFQCWGVGNAGVITGVIFSQIAMYPAQNVFQIVLAFGEGMTEHTLMIDATLFRFATLNGCTRAEITGRPGWGPELRRLGFKQSNTTFSKRLQQERTH